MFTISVILNVILFMFAWSLAKRIDRELEITNIFLNAVANDIAKIMKKGEELKNEKLCK